MMDQCLRVLLSMLACLRVLALESHDGAMSAPYTRVCVSARARKHARVLHVEAMLRFVTGTIGQDQSYEDGLGAVIVANLKSPTGFWCASRKRAPSLECTDEACRETCPPIHT